MGQLNKTLQADAVGVEFRLTVRDQGIPLDISLATVKDFVFAKPDGTKITKAGAFITSGVDGQIKYVTASGDLDKPGGWQLQAHIVAGALNEFSDIQGFLVIKNL